jgi:hypothetical protein
VSLPDRPDVIFGVLVAAKTGHQAAVMYLARNQLTGVCLVDCELGQLSPGLLHGAVARLLELSTLCSARHDPVMFSTTELVQVVNRLGYRAEVIDAVLADPTLAVSAASHVATGQVKICEPVLARGYPLSFLQAAAAVQDADPLALAFLAGIAISLDANRAAA